MMARPGPPPCEPPPPHLRQRQNPVLAALRQRMVALAAEIAQGVLFANASLSHLADSLSVVPPAKRTDPDFLIGNMLPVCITNDEGAALALHRRRLEHYVFLPNYRNYWKEAGYGEEMGAIEQALAENRRDDVPRYLTDRWIADNTLYGSAAKVRDQLAANAGGPLRVYPEWGLLYWPGGHVRRMQQRHGAWKQEAAPAS